MTTVAEPTIDDYDVLVALQDVVNEKGRDYVYERVDDLCVYEHDGEPSCLVGHVLARIAPDAQLGAGSVLSPYNREALRARGFSRRALAVLQIAQSIQDHELSWGTALTAAGAVYDFYREMCGE